MDMLLRERASYIVKVSGNCNLGCPYCYYFKDKSRNSKSVMAEGLLRKFFTEASQSSRQIEIIWHGGEPLAAGLELFRKAVKAQKELKKTTGVTFRNLLQTNGTLISQEWVNFFAEEDFGIGISLDGPKYIHDNYRVNLSNKSTFNSTMQGIKLLKTSNIPISVLAVVTKSSLAHARDIYDFFVNDLSLKRFDFLPMAEFSNLSYGDTKAKLPNSLDQGDFYAFIKTIFDQWWNDNNEISIRFLDNVLLGLLGKRPTSCTFNGSCGDYTTLDVDGSLSPCDNFIEYGNLKFGDVNKQNLNMILNSEARNNFTKQVTHVIPKCSECKFLKACGGGCKKYNYFSNQNFMDENYFCGDRWMIFNYVEQAIKRDQPLVNSILDSGKQTNKSAAIKPDSPGGKAILRLLRSYPIGGMQNVTSLSATDQSLHFGDTWTEWDRSGWDKNDWEQGGWD